MEESTLRDGVCSPSPIDLSMEIWMLETSSRKMDRRWTAQANENNLLHYVSLHLGAGRTSPTFRRVYL